MIKSSTIKKISQFNKKSKKVVYEPSKKVIQNLLDYSRALHVVKLNDGTINHQILN